MAMLLDGPPSTIADLTIRDCDLLNLAVVEGIDLSTKLQVTTTDVETAVESMLQSMLPSYAAVKTYFPALRHIAVTPQLKLWHTYATLRAVYQDLYYSRLNDRYREKMKLFREEEARALDDVRATGLGVTFHPLPQAPTPSIVTVQSPDAGGTIYLAASYVNGKSEEGLISLPVEADTLDGNSVTVTLTGFRDSATGWNLYAGLTPDTLTRQNALPLDPLDSMSLAPGRLIAGRKPGPGQGPNLLYPVPRRILRG